VPDRSFVAPDTAPATSFAVLVRLRAPCHRVC
jgi:hypothetical protein